jgi:BirA family biotin operon repressor/biotin-[acetyl-CoA-carboxylase] ligase
VSATIHHYDELGSTNDEAMRLAREGAADGTWVLADRQTAGRGRRGRAWESKGGNLFTTAIVRPWPGEGALSQLSFLVALALHEATTHWVARDRLALKWPNDVLLDGAKLSGVLLESASHGNGGDRWLVVGIGVNLADHPEGLERPAMSLAGAGVTPPTPRDFLEKLIEAFGVWRERWRLGGFAPIRTAWLARAAGLGQRIAVRLPDSTLEGQFLDVAEDGALLLRLDSGAIEPIHAGDIFGI